MKFRNHFALYSFVLYSWGKNGGNVVLKFAQFFGSLHLLGRGVRWKSFESR